ncbi:MAG TPA: glycosyltransferase family 2 protein [Anaerolineae bacterium]|nr:glycosyltransferase family 2 protein [Anaerolineae bacterium]
MLSLSVVIPAFNEEPNVAEALQRVSAVCQTLNREYEIILVNDGSRDRTGEIAKSMIGKIPNLRVVENNPNRGYGGALKAGFYAATMDLIVFVPSDNQFDFGQVDSMLEQIGGAGIVTGYRANDADPPMRRVNRWGWNLLVRLFFGNMARDIDCGFKLFRREILQHVTLNSDGAMVDTELLAGAQARGYKIVEVPLKHLPRTAGSPTGANLRVILRAFRDLVRFRLRLWRELDAESKSVKSATSQQ